LLKLTDDVGMMR